MQALPAHHSQEAGTLQRQLSGAVPRRSVFHGQASLLQRAREHATVEGDDRGSAVSHAYVSTESDTSHLSAALTAPQLLYTQSPFGGGAAPGPVAAAALAHAGAGPTPRPPGALRPPASGMALHRNASLHSAARTGSSEVLLGDAALPPRPQDIATLLHASVAVEEEGCTQVADGLWQLPAADRALCDNLAGDGDGDDGGSLLGAGAELFGRFRRHLTGSWPNRVSGRHTLGSDMLACLQPGMRAGGSSQEADAVSHAVAHAVTVALDDPAVTEEGEGWGDEEAQLLLQPCMTLGHESGDDDDDHHPCHQGVDDLGRHFFGGGGEEEEEEGADRLFQGTPFTTVSAFSVPTSPRASCTHPLADMPTTMSQSQPTVLLGQPGSSDPPSPLMLAALEGQGSRRARLHRIPTCPAPMMEQWGAEGMWWGYGPSTSPPRAPAGLRRINSAARAPRAHRASAVGAEPSVMPGLDILFPPTQEGGSSQDGGCHGGKDACGGAGARHEGGAEGTEMQGWPPAGPSPSPSAAAAAPVCVPASQPRTTGDVDPRDRPGSFPPARPRSDPAPADDGGPASVGSEGGGGTRGFLPPSARSSRCSLRPCLSRTHSINSGRTMGYEVAGPMAALWALAGSGSARTATATPSAASSSPPSLTRLGSGSLMVRGSVCQPLAALQELPEAYWCEVDDVDG